VSDETDEQIAEREDRERKAAQVIADREKAESQKRYKLKQPEIHLIEPKSRSFVGTNAPNKAPCGGYERAATHYLAKPGSRNFI